MSALFAFPKQAEVDRVLPKNKIYEHSGANSRLKDLFVDQVEQIVWRYKLAPETINLAAKPGVPEIQVFAIQLKTPELHHDVLRCIDGAVQFPIIFELSHGQEETAKSRAVAAYKRPGETAVLTWVCSRYFESPWSAVTEARTALPLALDLGGLYAQLLRTLLPLEARPLETIDCLVRRAEQVIVKENEIAKTRFRLAQTRQFNRKVEINGHLRSLLEELQELKS
ncbi:DUF4391 domain-containing protein [Leptothrix sp. BB-4]